MYLTINKIYQVVNKNVLSKPYQFLAATITKYLGSKFSICVTLGEVLISGLLSKV
jgi:hypothetical protein